MKKVFKMEDLDCANCAAQMETAASKIAGVNSVNISFMTQKMTLDADDSNFNNIVKEIVKVCKKIEPDCEILI